MLTQTRVGGTPAKIDFWSCCFSRQTGFWRVKDGLWGIFCLFVLPYKVILRIKRTNVSRVRCWRFTFQRQQKAASNVLPAMRIFSHYTGLWVHSGCCNKNIHRPGGFISRSTGGWEFQDQGTSRLRLVRTHCLVHRLLAVPSLDRRGEGALFLQGH